MTRGEDLAVRPFDLETMKHLVVVASPPAVMKGHDVLPVWRAYASGEPRWRAELHRLEQELGMAVRAIEPTATITSRLKSFPSTWRKIRARRIGIDELHDLLGLRILVNREPACYEVLTAILTTWPNGCQRLRDYISHPKPNGYRSLHVVMQPEAYSQFEVQIRTRRMHEESERGPAAHWRYKQSSAQQPSRVFSIRGHRASAAPTIAAAPLIA